METSEKCMILIKNELENKVLLLQTIFRCLAHIRIFTCSVKCDEELMVLLPPCSLHSFPSCTSSCSRKLNHLMERPNGVKCRGCVLTMVPLYSTKTNLSLNLQRIRFKNLTCFRNVNQILHHFLQILYFDQYIIGYLIA